VHTANDDQYGAGGDNPGNNTPVSFSSASSASSSAAAAAAPSVLQQFSEADVALAVKRAEEVSRVQRFVCGGDCFIEEEMRA